MVTDLETFLKSEGIKIDGYADASEAQYVIDFKDARGYSGVIEINIHKDNNKYQLSTTKGVDGYVPKNKKEVKSIRGVKTYIRNFLGTNIE